MKLAEQIGIPLVVVGAAVYLVEILGTTLVALGLVGVGGVLVAAAWARGA